MSLAVSSTQLNDALDTLKACWNETTPLWRDVVRNDFEENYWEPLLPQVESTLQAIDQMMQVLAKMRRECGD
jgi:hypothetical protein